MKLIVATSLLFVCSNVAAQDMPPAASSPPAAFALQDGPAPLFSPPPTTTKQENASLAPDRLSAPSLPPAPSGYPFRSPSKENSVAIRYMKKTPVQYQVARPDGTIETKTRMVYWEATEMVAIPSDADFENLDKVELEGDAKRAAIQAITAHRHSKLLQALKDAKSETEKEQAAKKLEENYRAHYASETMWRLDRLAELEKRLEEMRTQVKDRAAAEEKFLEAAMTLAKLNAQGIAAEPPQLKGYDPYHGETVVPSYGQIPVGTSVSYPTEPSNNPPAFQQR